MAKIRITITSVIEYEPDPAHYEGCTTLEQMAALDVEAAKGDVFAFIDMPTAEVTVKGEVIS